MIAALAILRAGHAYAGRRWRASQAEIGLRYRISAEARALAPERVWMTDPNQLENAVLNLAINARAAMPDGGILTLSTRRVEVVETRRFGQDELPPGDFIQIRVSDTGSGIAPEALGKVFEPFFTTKPIGKGTGLGLSRSMGRQAEPWRRSDREYGGRGTDVTLFLPRYRGALHVDSGSQDRVAPQGAGETVLLVEDDSSVRLLIGEVLRDLGYACIEASDGQTALPVLTSNTRLDLMITDVGLPGMNGRQLADFAREHRPDLQILFVTGYAEQVAGGDDFLDAGMSLVTKPFNLDVLAYKIREILSPR